MDEGDDEESEDVQTLERDLKIMEEVMEEEIVQVAKKVKPVHQVLFKVSLCCCLCFYSTLLYSGPLSMLSI